MAAADASNGQAHANEEGAVKDSPPQTTSQVDTKPGGDSTASVAMPADSAAASSSPLTRQITESFKPLEARLTADHIMELTANARLMEGDESSGGGGEKQWFQPSVEVHNASESGVRCLAVQDGGYLAVRLGSKVYRIDVVTTFTEIMITVTVLFVMYLVLGSGMQPGGSVFGPLTTILIGSAFGTLIATLLGVPPLVGMLVAGMVWGNLPGDLASVSDTMYKFLRNVAVAIILARAGLTFKWRLTKPVLGNVIIQGVFPQLCECFAHAGLAMALFPSYFPNFTFALYEGAAIAASSTAVVIPGVSWVQERGYSVTRGPGILMLCSVALDAVFAVWFTSFIFEFMFPNEASNAPLAVKIALAPVQIIGGAIIGIFIGFICHFLINLFWARVSTAQDTHRETVERNSRLKALTLCSAFGVGNIFLFYQVGYPGAGTVAVVCTSGTLAVLWGRDPATDVRRQLLYKDTARLWDSLVMPCLFTVVGSTIDGSILINMNMLPSILLCVAFGLFAKICGCMLSSAGAGYTYKEKLFLAFGWCAKSTVQAATAGKVIVHVAELTNSGWADGNPARIAFLEQAEKAGLLINTIVVTSILFCAVGAGISMKVLGPRFLVKEEGVPLPAGGGH